MSSLRKTRKGGLSRVGQPLNTRQGDAWLLEREREAHAYGEVYEEGSKGLVFDGWGGQGSTVRTAHGELARLGPYVRELKRRAKES